MTGNRQSTNRQQLLHLLLETALRLMEDDIDNADRHARIADSLATYGKRKFGRRFGDHLHKPRSDTMDVTNE